MKNFPGAAFQPEAIERMEAAMEGAIATLPEPISSGHVRSIAESILRTAKDGEEDVRVLQRMALLELQLSIRD